MPELRRILDPIPLKWRFSFATFVPLIIGITLYPLIGFWAFAVSAAVAVGFVWLLSKRQTRYFVQTATGILRTRAIDRRHRLSIEGPAEQQRIAHAVNRLADSVEATLAESERNRRYHETILNELTVGILVVDGNGILQYANPAACELLGFEFDPNHDDQIPLSIKVSIYEINEAVAASANIGEMVHRNVEVYDTQRHLEVIARGLTPSVSDVGRAMVIINDRTDEIRLAVAMREFVANASHELRTPIASVQASVETLKISRSAMRSQDVDRFLDRINDGTRRMNALVSELMDLTLLETGRSVLHVSEVPAEDLIAAVLDSHGPTVDGKTHQIDIDVKGPPSSVLIDLPKMERAIGNLLVNAQKFTPDGGRIRIGCRATEDEVLFEVEDTGVGIDTEDLPHIFQRFYKSQRSDHDRSGFGLGLAITQNIVDMHGGSVEVASAIGEGSRFTVRLPNP